MSSEQDVTTDLLRRWGLPSAGDSKYSRGQVVVVGGAARSPGAAMLAGVAALRVGAGRLTLAVGASVAAHVAVAVPESGVVALPDPDGHVSGTEIDSARDDLNSADAVLVGPGLDDIDETETLLNALGEPDVLRSDCTLVLDAFALGALARTPRLRDRLPDRMILTPNKDEVELLADHSSSVLRDDVAEVAQRYRAAVTCYGHIADPTDAWRMRAGGEGLGTSGSGDVLAGAIAGFAARGLTPSHAAVWGTQVHAVTGDRLSITIGPLGYLARDLLPELTRTLAEISA